MMKPFALSLSKGSPSTGSGRTEGMFGSKAIILAGVAPNAALGATSEVLQTDKGGENFQGVYVALVEVDADGKPVGFRTVADGFCTGERFKLRVLSTFEAIVVLGNITPKGAQRQIYPDSGSEAVCIPVGKEVKTGY